MDGTCSFLPAVNLLDLTSKYILPPSGQLPLRQLVFPAFIGACTVGSVERRIERFIQNIQEDSKKH